MALALDGSYAHNGLESKTEDLLLTLTTTQPNDVIIIVVEYEDGSGVVSIAGGLTWGFRKKIVFDRGKGLSLVYVEEWWAVSPTALNAQTFTVTFSGASSANGCIFGISGADTSSPFDQNASLPNTMGQGNPAVVSTSNADNFIIGSYSTGISEGSGWTLIGLIGGYPGIVEYKIVNAIQTNLTIPTGPGDYSGGGIGDAVKAAAAVVTVPDGGGGEWYPPHILQTTWEEKKAKPFQPIWDRVRQQKAEEERLRAQSPQEEPAPRPRKAGPPPADIFRAVAPAARQFPDIDTHDDVSRIAVQMANARDFADLSAAFSTLGQQQSNDDSQDDNRDLADLADAIRQIQDMLDFADISMAFASLDQFQQPIGGQMTDSQDMADLAEVFGHLSTLTH